MFVIKDWADNVMYPGPIFKSFDDAWSFIHLIYNDDEYDDFYVEQEDND